MEQNNTIKIELVKNVMKCLNHATSGFKITRIINGITVDIELSDQELSNAFYYQEHNFHICDIAVTLEKMENEKKLYGYTAEKIQADEILMAKIISDYEDNRDEYNMEWNEAAVEAIKKNIKETENADVSEQK